MKRFEINGIVQGVGFRPFVYNLARKLKLNGYVLNSTNGVEIELEGTKKALIQFKDILLNELPPAAKIEELVEFDLSDAGYSDFEIRQSLSKTGSTFISPDLAVCKDCVQELFKKSDKRHEYTFINCTNCGPRYSIIEKTPYDRPVTSMKTFEMCSFCESEYRDPTNRRFHAQPIACPVCGPQLKFLDNNLNEIFGDPIENCLKYIKEGKIVGIKGIGGFHIACDATDRKAVAELRRRKNRPDKPFAVMCAEENLQNIVEYNSAQLDLLKSVAAPIVLFPKKVESPIVDSVAPYNPNLGVFLPYAPHHHQIFQKPNLYLIMTSGNLNDEPIASDEKELQGICDYFLTHNRPILNRTDDSVIRPSKRKNIFLRRSRGYVPSPLKLPFKTIPTLGTGAELKISFALAKEDSIWMSPYIGNNNSKETEDFFTETLTKFQDWFKIKPELVACDLQPDFMTTRFAEKLNLPLVKVQHHHAHVAAVMAENMLDEPVIGISYDGTGYGLDGAIWGGEIFVGDYQNFERKFHLKYMPLPGGDAAIKHPVRIAFSYLQQAGENPDFLTGISEIEKKIIFKQITNNFNVFQTSSMGRLFDCISAMLGLFPNITFEAQSAMALEFLCGTESLEKVPSYSYEIDNGVIDFIPLIKAVTNDIRQKKSRTEIALRFHKTVIDFTVQAVQKVKKETGLSKIVLSGGVMQNNVLLEGLYSELEKNCFTVFTPSQLPSNDGAISAGQVMIANRVMRRD
ncbi:MAG: carbamoyltransferase HypF [Candidatus Cloacimonadales bacterium]|nr:carbamoyltransferase HypF [Candidatus Cloacimonadales bacterium]